MKIIKVALAVTVFLTLAAMIIAKTFQGTVLNTLMALVSLELLANIQISEIADKMEARK